MNRPSCVQAKEEAAKLELKVTTAEAQVEAAKQQAQTYRVSHVCLLRGTGTGDYKGKESSMRMSTSMVCLPVLTIIAGLNEPNRKHICAG